MSTAILLISFTSTVSESKLKILECYFQTNKNNVCGITGRKVINDLKNANYILLIKNKKFYTFLFCKNLTFLDLYSFNRQRYKPKKIFAKYFKTLSLPVLIITLAT